MAMIHSNDGAVPYGHPATYGEGIDVGPDHGPLRPLPPPNYFIRPPGYRQVDPDHRGPR